MYIYAYAADSTVKAKKFQCPKVNYNNNLQYTTSVSVFSEIQCKCKCKSKVTMLKCAILILASTPISDWEPRSLMHCNTKLTSCAGGQC